MKSTIKKEISKKKFKNIILKIFILFFFVGLLVSPKIDANNNCFFNFSEGYSFGEETDIIDDKNSLEIIFKNSGWISIPFFVDKEEYYNLTLYLNGSTRLDIRIDGEIYESLENKLINNEFSFNVLLEKGHHSLILQNKKDSKIKLNLYYLSVNKLEKNPDSFVDTKKEPVNLTPYSRYFEIGDMFSGSYVNINIARDMALISKDNYQYISYYNSRGYLVVGKRNLNQTYFEKYWVPIKSDKAPIFPDGTADFSLIDPHNYPSMQIDKKGYIHIAFGHHNNKLKYVRSKFPYDISQWEILDSFSGEKEESYVTYIRFIKTKEGDLLAVFRNGPHGHGDSILYHYDADKKNWSKIFSPFITDYGDSSPYLWRPVVSQDGTIHLAWTYRLSNFTSFLDSPTVKKDFSGFTNKDIFYAQSKDEGKTWTDSKQNLYEIPICKNKKCSYPAEIIQKIPMGEDFFNHYGSDYDSKGNPHFVYTKRDPKTKIAQQWHLYFNGSNWINNKVTEYSKKIQWTNSQQNGRASTSLTRPSIIIAEDDSALVISRTKENNNVIEFYISNFTDYNHWEKIIIYNNPVGGWEPQMDLDYWHSSNKINLVLLGITDDAIKKDWEENNPKKSFFDHIKDIIRNILRKKSLEFNNKEPSIKSSSLNYYSNIKEVEILETDSSLKKDTGYILEIDYPVMIKEIRV